MVRILTYLAITEHTLTGGKARTRPGVEPRPRTADESVESGNRSVASTHDAVSAFLQHIVDPLRGEPANRKALHGMHVRGFEHEGCVTECVSGSTDPAVRQTGTGNAEAGEVDRVGSTDHGGEMEYEAPIIIDHGTIADHTYGVGEGSEPCGVAMPPKDHRVCKLDCFGEYSCPGS